MFKKWLVLMILIAPQCLMALEVPKRLVFLDFDDTLFPTQLISLIRTHLMKKPIGLGKQESIDQLKKAEGFKELMESIQTEIQQLQTIEGPTKVIMLSRGTFVRDILAENQLFRFATEAKHLNSDMSLDLSSLTDRLLETDVVDIYDHEVLRRIAGKSVDDQELKKVTMRHFLNRWDYMHSEPYLTKLVRDSGRNPETMSLEEKRRAVSETYRITFPEIDEDFERTVVSVGDNDLADNLDKLGFATRVEEGAKQFLKGRKVLYQFIRILPHDSFSPQFEKIRKDVNIARHNQDWLKDKAKDMFDHWRSKLPLINPEITTFYRVKRRIRGAIDFATCSR